MLKIGELCVEVQGSGGVWELYLSIQFSYKPETSL